MTDIERLKEEIKRIDKTHNLYEIDIRLTESLRLAAKIFENQQKQIDSLLKINENRNMGRIRDVIT